MLRKDIPRPSAVAAGTADPAEIARFETLAEDWWKPTGAFKMVHTFNAARVAHLAQRLPVLLGRDPLATRPLQGLRIVDVGCGAGLVSEPLARLGATMTGIDATERNILVARRHALESRIGIDYRHATPELIADPPFDAVLALEVIEHVADLRSFLAATGRLVAPGGVLVIGTINRTLRSFVKAVLGAEYILHWLPKGTHDWRRFVTPRELDRALSPLGFSTIERVGVAFHPIGWRWRLGRDDSATYLQFHRKTED